MKLILEQVERFETLVEADETGKKNFFIEGIYMMGETPNKNGRIYPMSVLDPEVNRYIKEHVEGGDAYGECGHPAGPTINPDRISHRIVKLQREGNNFIGKAKINNNPMGQIVRGLIEDGGRMGVSSRGLGSLKPRGAIMEVQSDFKLAAVDVVVNPSAPSAFVNGILEGVEYIFDPIKGTWLEEKMHDVQTNLKEMSKEEREAKAFSLMEAFFDKFVKLQK